MNGIYVRGALETALAVAGVVVEGLLGGDARRLGRGESDPVLRSLAEHGDLRVPAHTLWTALAVYEQVQLLPEDLVPQLPLSHHRLLLAVPDEEAKEDLAQRAVSASLSKSELQEVVTRWRRKNSLPPLGRPPRDPALVASRRMSIEALRLARALEARLPIGEEKRQVLRKMELTETRLRRARKAWG